MIFYEGYLHKLVRYIPDLYYSGCLVCSMKILCMSVVNEHKDFNNSLCIAEYKSIDESYRFRTSQESMSLFIKSIIKNRLRNE
jgi:hypothetical protein